MANTLPARRKLPMIRLLPGHPFHDKSDDSLRYIIRDAGEAALAMRGHNEVAEAKYLDQVNDACTILNARKGG